MTGDYLLAGLYDHSEMTGSVWLIILNCKFYFISKNIFTFYRMEMINYIVWTHYLCIMATKWIWFLINMKLCEINAAMVVSYNERWKMETFESRILFGHIWFIYGKILIAKFLSIVNIQLIIFWLEHNLTIAISI